MKTKYIALTALALGLVAGGGYGLWALGMHQGMTMMSAPIGAADGQTSGQDPSSWSIPQGEAATRRHMEAGIKAGDVDPETGLAVQYYHDPMVPGRKFDSPGKSPFMDMMLVPAYSGANAADNSSVQVSPRIQQNLGIRTAAVEVGVLAPEITASGAVQWNERDRVVVQSRAMGFVEQLSVTATLDYVKQGQTLMTLYVPEWVAAQEEILALKKMQGDNLQPLIDAARQRMLQAGMNKAQVQQVERSGRVQPRVAIAAPRSGVVTGLLVREGMTVQPGATLVEINGLSTVWVQAEVPESQAAYVRRGVGVRATAQALPGKEFDGEVQAVLPQVNANTRTLLARLVLNNPTGELIPGMFVQTRFLDTSRPETLTVPSEAVIQTGRRAVVMLSEKEGRFMPVEIKTGIEYGGKTEVLAGLVAGQQVVLSGQFLIDSESSLRGLEAKLNDAEPKAETSSYTTTVVIEAIHDDSVTMTHPPIPELGWPEMTMDFLLPDPATVPRESLQVGDKVDMEFKVQDEDLPLILKVTPIDPRAKSNGAKP